MSIGQGNISFSEPPAAGGSAATARNGLSIDGSGFVVLGNDNVVSGYPAQLISDRFIPMMGFVLELQTQFSGDDCTVFNDQFGQPDHSKILFAMSQQSYFILYQPENYDTDYTPNGVGARFGSSYALYNGVNPDGRPNVTGTFWGYNNGTNDGRINPLEASFRFTTETYYQIGGDPHFEFHLPEITTSGGTLYRLDSTYVSRVTGEAFRQRIQFSEEIYSVDFPVGSPAWFLARYDTATVSLEMGQNTAGSVTQVRILNLSSGRGCTLEYADGADQMFVNTGATTVFSISSKDIFLQPQPGEYTSIGNTGAQMVVYDNANVTPSTATALLELHSTTKGFLPPIMTSTQRLAIVAPAEGLHVYDATTHQGFYWNGTTWTAY